MKTETVSLEVRGLVMKLVFELMKKKTSSFYQSPHSQQSLLLMLMTVFVPDERFDLT